MQIVRYCFAALLAMDLSAFAQVPPPLISPEIREDRGVTFRLLAPGVQRVELRAQWSKEPVLLVKNEGGVWSATVPEVPRGVWEYSFVADGLTILDPSNPSFKP